MRTIFELVKKEYRLFWADKTAVSLTFIVPIALIALWGSIFGRADSGPSNIRLAFLNQSPSPVGKKIESVLDTTKTFRLVKTLTDEEGKNVPFDTALIKEYVRKGSASAALVIPSDALNDTSFGLKLKFYYDPKNQMEMQIVEGVLTQTIMSQLPNVFIGGLQQRTMRVLGIDSGKAFNEGMAEIVSRYFPVEKEEVLKSMTGVDTVFFQQDSGARDFFKNILNLESEQLVGKEIANPWATRSVGGWAMMFLLFALTGSSTSLFDEKKSGVVLRLLASPVSRVQILWSKYLYNMSVGFIQLIVLFAFGSLLFNIDVLSNLPNLIAIIIAAATACTAFGMLLAAVSKTSAQANGLGTLLILAMSSIGGAWFPTSFMPDFIQTVSKGTIVYWSMDGFLQVLWRGSSFVEILPNIIVLLAMAAVITSISVWQFKKGHVF